MQQVTPVATTQPCHCRAKAAIDNVQTNAHGYTAIQLYLQKQVAGHSLLIPVLEERMLIVNGMKC